MNCKIDPVAFLEELKKEPKFGGMCGCGEYQGGLSEMLDLVEKMLKSRYPEAFEKINERDK